MRTAAILIGSSIVIAAIFVLLSPAFPRITSQMDLFWILHYALAAGPAWGFVGGVVPGLAAALAAVLASYLTRGFFPEIVFPALAGGLAGGLVGGLATAYVRDQRGGRRWGPRSRFGRALAVGAIWYSVGTTAHAIPAALSAGKYFVFMLFLGMLTGLPVVLVGTITGGLLAALGKE